MPWGVYVEAVLNAEDRKFTSIRNTPAIPADPKFRADPLEVARLTGPREGDRAWVYRLFARWVLGETIGLAQRSNVEAVLGRPVNWKTADRMNEWGRLA